MTGMQQSQQFAAGERSQLPRERSAFLALFGLLGPLTSALIRHLVRS